MLFADESTIEKRFGNPQVWTFRKPWEKFNKDYANAKPTAIQVGQMACGGMVYYEHGCLVPIGPDPVSGRRGWSSKGTYI